MYLGNELTDIDESNIGTSLAHEVCSLKWVTMTIEATDVNEGIVYDLRKTQGQK